MNKRLSKDFYIILTLLLIFFALFLFLTPIKRALGNIFQHDIKVIKKYYAALNKRSYKTAYGFLADLTLKYKTEEGKNLEFDIRPDYKKFIKNHEKIKSIKISSIKRENKYCYPEVGLSCFKVEAVIKYKDLVVAASGGKINIYVYTLNTGKEPLILGIRTTP